MSLTSTTLASIQQAGAAVFAADAALKQASQAYAEQVTKAMAINPYGLGNDALFEHWKLVARLSQAVAGMEEELRKVYHLAEELVDDALIRESPLALAAPAEVNAQALNLDLVDVVAKAPMAARPPKARRAKKPVRTQASGPAPDSNPMKLLHHLAPVLNDRHWTRISQSASAKSTGIPLGSMTAALKKLVETGHLLAGKPGHFKLAHVRSA
jgi:hypothetical protein